MSNKYKVYHIGKDGKEEIYDVTNDNFKDRNWHKTLRVNKDKKSIRYLGDQIGPSSGSIKKRIILAEIAYAILQTKLWAQSDVQVKMKVLVFKAIIMSTLWTQMSQLIRNKNEITKLVLSSKVEISIWS